MSTNSVDIVNWVGEKVNALQGAPVWLLVVLGSLALGLMLKAIKVFPNKFIPSVVLPAAAFSNAALMWAFRPQGMTKTAWGTRQVTIGIVLGLVTWVLHRVAIKRIEDKFPWVKDALVESGIDTAPPIKPTESPSEPQPKP